MLLCGRAGLKGEGKYMGLFSAVKRLATGQPSKDQIYKIQRAGAETYVHNWKQIDQLCVEAAVVFLREERSTRFREMRRQVRSWIYGIQFELYKLDVPEIANVREGFEELSGLKDSIMLTMLNHNEPEECADELIQKYLKSDARQEWFRANSPELMSEIDDEWMEIEKKLESD